MAINKNFVIKNGVQVATDLIVGDSDTKKVGIGTTVAGYTLHVAATNAGGRGGIGATDAVITGVGTIKDLLVTGFSGFSSDVSVTGVVSARSFGIGTTEIIDRGMRLSGIASLDAITIATIEEAIRVGPNSFTDLKVTGISTFIGIATFSTGIDIKSGVSTFSAPLRLGFAHTTDHAGVALGATVGFGTSAFFRDDAAIFMGSDSDLKIHHDGSNSRIQDVGTGDLIIQGSADIKLQSASAENYIVANDTGSVDVYFDNSKKLETTSGGLKVTGITTLTNRLHVQAGVSTFDADVRFGIGATVGFGTSAFFRDDAAIFLGNDSDLKIYHDGSNSYIQDDGTGELRLRGTNIRFSDHDGSETFAFFNDNGQVELYYDNSKKLESTSGGLNVTGITTFSDRINVVSGVSTFQDNATLTFGTQTDLLIKHDGTDTEIYNKTGNLKIRSNDLDIQDYTNGHSMITADRDGSVDLYYDNYNALQTTPQGINVSGVTTSNRLNISGVSTFNGAIDANSTSNFADDVVFAGAAANITFDRSTDDLIFDDNAQAIFGSSSDGLHIFHDGSHSQIQDQGTGNLYITGSSSVNIDNQAGEQMANFNVDGAVELFYDNSKKVETTSGGLNVTGITTISDRLQVTSGISTFYDTTQSSSATTGAVVLDGGLGVAKNVNIGGNLTVTGTTTLNGGTVTLGDADTDNVVFSADVDSNIIPDDDDTYDLGTSTKEWQDLFLDGTAHIDTLDVDESAFVTTTLTVGTGLTVHPHGNLAVAGITTIGGDLSISDKIIHSSDTNTAIRFPAVDNISFETSGTERLLFADDGNIFINGDQSGNNRGVIYNNTNGLFIYGASNAAVDREIRFHTSSDSGSEVASIETTGLHVITGGVFVGTGVTIQTHGGVSIAGITTIGGQLDCNSSVDIASGLDVNSTQQSTSVTSGAAVIDGGLGLAKNLFMGGILAVGTGLTVHPHGNLAVAGIVTVGGALDVNSTSNFGADVVFDGAGANITFDQSTDDLIFEDNAKAIFGGSGTTADGLEVYHDGSNSYISDTGTGDLIITGTVLRPRTDSFVLNNAANSQNMISATGGDKVTLFHAGSTKLVTDVGGVKVTGVTTSTGFAVNGGNLTLQDSGSQNDDRIVLGTGSDFHIFFDGSNSILREPNAVAGQLIIDGYNGTDIRRGETGHNMGRFIGGGAVELYHNNVKAVETTADGILVGTGVTIQKNGGVSIAGITTIGGNLGVTGNITATGDATFSGGDLTVTGTNPIIHLTDTNDNSDFQLNVNGGTFIVYDYTNSSGRLFVNSAGDVTVGSGVTFQQNGGVSIAGFTTAGTGIKIPSGGIEVQAGGANITGELDLVGHLDLNSDTHKIKLGAGDDFQLYHNGTDNYIETNNGDINITTTGDDVNITAADDINLLVQGGENGVAVKGDGEVILYHNSSARVTTTSDGADFGGTGGIRIPNGTTGERSGSAASGDFRYNTTTGKFEGYTDEWGDIGGGSVEEVDTSVSTTSATSCGSFAIASFRSASIIAQITQGSNYQVGRYLVIHDGTNVTTIEESAVATGSMLGTFEGVINSSNLEFRVTMGSSSSATVTTKIDTVTV